MSESERASLNEKARQVARHLLDSRRGAPPAGEGSPESAEHRGVDYRQASLFVHWFDRLLRAHKATALAVTERTLATTTDGCEDTELLTALATVHRTLMTHPTATKAVYRALVAEGRRHARSAEGAELRDRLSRSPEIRRAAMVWRTLSLDMFDDDHDGELPSTYLDHLLSVVHLQNPAGVLGSLFATDGGAS